MTFARLDDRSTRVTVRIEEEPEGLVERAGEALGLLDRRVRSDLERFKETVEAGGGHVTPGEEAPPTADTVPAGTESTAGSPGPTPMREQGGM